jgi:hypothetical protein
MKKQIKHFWLILPIWLIAIVLPVGCASRAYPLKDWQSSSLQSLQSNKAISDDYQNYVHRLPLDMRQAVGPVDFFEDTRGQHAVRITIALNGTWLEHILVYDKENKRINLIKYSPGKYRS